jgi:hypothetical protein
MLRKPIYLVVLFVISTIANAQPNQKLNLNLDGIRSGFFD